MVNSDCVLKKCSYSIPMSLIWIFFASLTVVGSLMYNISIKLATSHMNAFIFTSVFTVFALLAHLVCLVVYKYVFKFDVALTIDNKGLWYSVIAGLGVALIDIAYFFALRYGSMIASQTVWTIGGLIGLTIVAVLFFQETLTLQKACGITLGIISLYLVTRS